MTYPIIVWYILEREASRTIFEICHLRGHLDDILAPVFFFCPASNGYIVSLTMEGCMMYNKG